MWVLFCSKRLLLLPIYTSSLTKLLVHIQNTHYRCRHWPLNVDLACRHSRTAREKSANGILCRHARSIFYLSYELFIRHGVYVCKHSTKINVCYFEFKLCFHIAIHEGVLAERCQPQHYTNRRTNCLFTLHTKTNRVALS